MNTQTCPGYINAGSAADWVNLVMVGVVWWWVVGVLKATVISIRRHESTAWAAVVGSLIALGVAFVALSVAAFSSVCA